MRKKTDEQGNIIVTKKDGSTYSLGPAKRQPFSNPVNKKKQKAKKRKETLARKEKERQTAILKAEGQEGYQRLGLADKRAVAPKIYLMNKCNISATCLQLGIERRTFYNWRQNFASFDKKILDIEEAIIDNIEGVVKDLAIDGMDLEGCKFFLNNKAKHRGIRQRRRPW